MIIPRHQLEEMFQKIRAASPFNIDGDLLWGYFFTHTSRAPLDAASAQLVASGHRLVSLRLDDTRNTWWLHVEKVETHTVDSLDQRNHELSAFANKLGLTSYDGMDVGPV
jgi:hypothetical protein